MYNLHNQKDLVLKGIIINNIQAERDRNITASLIRPKLAYKTEFGRAYRGSSELFLRSKIAKSIKGKVQLIFTSPPFPLNRKKKYGNLEGEDYINWLISFGPYMRDLLTPDGSIVIELGNAWEPGKPVMSTLSLRTLLSFLDSTDLQLCQQFICYNPARLPSPAQWVNVERIRVKDSYTHVWWMAPSDRPKANNRQVLREYSNSMKKLLASSEYNSGKRPSEHNIGEKSFLTNNNGAIPSNVLTFANTRATDPYQRYCIKRKLPIHPARMPLGLPEFFIQLTTDVTDLVFDPFAGSNITGAIAEKLERNWVSVEIDSDYVAGSWGWFK